MRLLQRLSSSYSCGFAALALAAVVAGCASSSPSPAKQADPKTQSGATAGAGGALTDPLRISDRVKIEIFGTPEPTTPSEQEIGGDGTVRLDLVGSVPAVGKTPVQVAKDIQDALVPKYYAHVAVTVTPSGRFFYVGGEVNSGGAGGGGGRIIYSGPITLTRAIDAAGGFNPFANKKKVRLTRVDGTVLIVNCRQAVLHPEDDRPVYPGDTIFIPRRF